MATQTMPVEVMLLLQPHGQATIHRIFASVPPHQPIWRFLFAHQFREVKKPGTHLIAANSSGLLCQANQSLSPWISRPEAWTLHGQSFGGCSGRAPVVASLSIFAIFPIHILTYVCIYINILYIYNYILPVQLYYIIFLVKFTISMYIYIYQ